MAAVLVILAMLASLRMAPGGSAPPIRSVALRGGGSAGRDGKAGASIEPESWICETVARTRASRSGLSVTAAIGAQLRVSPLQRRGLRSTGGTRADQPARSPPSLTIDNGFYRDLAGEEGARIPVCQAGGGSNSWSQQGQRFPRFRSARIVWVSIDP
jgi:hypothetical protein